MTFVEHFRLMQRIHNLIRTKSTGSPKELAERLEISRSALFRYMEDLKTLGATIQYCRFRQSYYYEENFVLEI